MFTFYFIASAIHIFLDSQLLLDGQVDHVQEAFAVSSAAKLKPYLEWEDLATVTHALIVPWLDCCNSFYFGAFEDHSEWSSAWSSSFVGWHESWWTYCIYFIGLHWLPKVFQALVLINNALYSLTPGYLQNYLSNCIQPNW